LIPRWGWEVGIFRSVIPYGIFIMGSPHDSPVAKYMERKCNESPLCGPNVRNVWSLTYVQLTRPCARRWLCLPQLAKCYEEKFQELFDLYLLLGLEILRIHLKEIVESLDSSFGKCCPTPRFFQLIHEYKHCIFCQNVFIVFND
jgi:hypothetical protein